MDLNELDIKMKGFASTVTGIKGYVFDDLSKINKHDKKKYPFLMFNPPVSSIPDSPRLEYEDFTMEFFMLDLYKGAEKKTASLSKKWSELHDLGRAVLKLLGADSERPDLAIIGAIGIERGHQLHNSTLVGVKYTVPIRLFDCIP